MKVCKLCEVRSQNPGVRSQERVIQVKPLPGLNFTSFILTPERQLLQRGEPRNALAPPDSSNDYLLCNLNAL